MRISAERPHPVDHIACPMATTGCGMVTAVLVK
jgi:hypothetical protein